MNNRVSKRPNRRKVPVEKLERLIQIAEKCSDKGTQRVDQQREKLFK